MEKRFECHCFIIFKIKIRCKVFSQKCNLNLQQAALWMFLIQFLLTNKKEKQIKEELELKMSKKEKNQNTS